MDGPFELTHSEIDAQVTKTAPGVYGFGNISGTFKLLGREGSDLNTRLKKKVGGYKYFWYQYTESEKEAFDQECIVWHSRGGPSGDLSKTHPMPPDGSGWKCPKCLRGFD